MVLVEWREGTTPSPDRVNLFQTTSARVYRFRRDSFHLLVDGGDGSPIRAHMLLPPEKPRISLQPSRHFRADIVLFGDSKITYGGVYCVIVDPSTNQIAMVRSGIGIIQVPGPLAVGQTISGLTVQFIGSPFG